MTMQSTLIILGVVVLGLVFIISFWKDRVGGIFSRKQRMPVLRERRNHGLTPSKDFFLDPQSRNDDVEPVLDTLPSESNNLEDLKLQVQLDDLEDESIANAETETKDHTDDTEQSFENTLFPEKKKKRSWRGFGKQKSAEPKQSEIFADLPIVKDRVELPADAIQSAELAEQEIDTPDADLQPEEAGVSISEGSLKQFDYWVRIYGDDPVTRDQVLGIYKQQEYLLEHPHSLHGRLVSNGEWTTLDEVEESTEFADVILTLQLADQTGPVGESELTKFTNLVFSISEALDRKFKFQCSVEEAQAQAARLNEFSKQYDLLAVVNICAEEGKEFRGPAVVRAVEGARLHYGDMQVFHGPDGDDGKPQFTLANMVKPGIFELGEMDDFTTPGLTLFMNVPKCSKPEDVFSKMAATAEKISTNLGGVLKDQKFQSLDEKAVKGIRQQVGDIGKEMAELGIAPGSEEAMRLF